MDQKSKTVQGVIALLDKVAKVLNLKNYEVLPNVTSLRGEGFLSDFFTGEILNKNNEKKIYVALKTSPTVQIWTQYPSAHLNELNFYEKIFPILDKFQKGKQVKKPFNKIAKYYTGSAEEENRFLALENLRYLDFSMHTKSEYFTPEQLEFVFKVYGQYHALSFALHDQKPDEFEFINNISVNLMKEVSDEEFIFKPTIDTYNAALKCFDPLEEADILVKLKKIENIKEAYVDAVSYEGKHKCLVHGDCWSNNMLFKFEDDKLKDIRLIDFQMASINSPIYDLSYFFYSAASKVDLDKLDYYLDIYYASLSDFASELGSNAEFFFPKSILKEEWRRYSLFGVIFGLNVWAGKLLQNQELSDMLNKENMPLLQYYDLLSERIVDVRLDKPFRERARNLYLHVVEYGIL